MFSVMYLVVTVGLIVPLGALVLAIVKGRAEPLRRIPWIIALVVLIIDTALHAAASVGLMVAAATGEGTVMDGAWLLIGTGGFLATLAVAILRPRWAGLLLLASAAVVPLVFALGSLTVQPEVDAGPPWPVALVAYSIPSAVAGGLLVLATTPARRRDERPQLVSATMRG